MLKNTRENAKQAFFLFTDANNFSPGYQESVEMIQQAKFNATLKVIVEPTSQNFSPWSFDPVLFGTQGNQFVRFYTPQEAENQKLPKVDQYLKIIVNGYQESRPTITKTIQTYSDSVSVGEKTVNNQKVQILKQITAKMTVFEKQISTSGSLQLLIRDAGSNAELSNTDIVSRLGWSDRWATCTGDARAIPQGVKGLCTREETNPNSAQLMNQAKRDLDYKLANALQSFYRNY